MSRYEEDRLLCTKTKSDKFTIKSLYTAMELGNLVSFPMRIIWNSWVQPRMSFFAWEAKWVKALILNQVQRLERLYQINMVCLWAKSIIKLGEQGPYAFF